MHGMSRTNLPAGLILLSLLIGASPAPVSAGEFSFHLERPSTTSAGIFDEQGRLARVLWTMKELPAGQHDARWDGLDDVGQLAAGVGYRYRVVLNGSSYRNVGAIGNDAVPPSAEGHTPSGMIAVAADADGGIYTANTWDETGAHVTKWDADGKTVYRAASPVQPFGGAFRVAVDAEHVYCAYTGWAPNEAVQQVRRFRRADGQPAPYAGRPDGAIALYDATNYRVPEAAAEADKVLLKEPLRALAIAGDALLVADALGNRVLQFDKRTGERRGEWPVKLPTALAVDPRGRVWVGHEHRKLSVWNDLHGGAPVAVTDDARHVEALSAGPQDRLYVADRGAGQVKVYDTAGPVPALLRTLGQPAGLGDHAADRFYRLQGVAADRDGGVVTIDRLPGVGARIARWTPTGQLLWDRKGLEFMTIGNYGPHDPDVLYSLNHKRYRLGDRDQGTWAFRGHMVAYELIDGRWPKFQGFGPAGVPRVLRFGERDFFYNPSGDGMQVYRIEPDALKLASLVGGNSPNEEGKLFNMDPKSIPFTPGQWTWSDADGDGRRDTDEFRWHAKPGAGVWAVAGINVDGRGDLWFANLHPHSIWTLPRSGLDAQGNPTYDFARQREVVPRDDTPTRFRPKMVHRADDGSVYALGHTADSPGKFHGGGTCLVKYDDSAQRLWAVRLPEECTGMDLVPGGAGLFLGGGVSATVYHYTADGLLIGKMAPGDAMGGQSGWLDNTGSLAASRDPRDGVVDVFTEDVFVGRIGWYRVDDRDIRRIEGPLPQP